MRETTAIGSKPLFGSAHIPAEIHLGAMVVTRCFSPLLKSSGLVRLGDCVQVLVLVKILAMSIISGAHTQFPIACIVLYILYCISCACVDHAQAQ